VDVAAATGKNGRPASARLVQGLAGSTSPAATGGNSVEVSEFLLGFVGVVIGLGVADLLTSFHKLLRARGRVRWDWLTVFYAVYMLYALIIMFWWQFDYPPRGTSYTIWAFIPNFIYLASAFLMVASALPDDVPASGIDLREYYLETLKYRWGLVAVTRAVNLMQGIYYNLIVAPITREAVAMVIGYTILLALSLIAMRLRATWYQCSLIVALFCLSSFVNLFRPIGP
jgi:hypothetical protein